MTRSVASKPSPMTRSRRRAGRASRIRRPCRRRRRPDIFARLLGADRRVGDEQRQVRRRAGHADAAEHARGEQAVGIGEDRAAADRARGRADDVVDEIDLAGVVEILFVDQLERDRNAGVDAVLALVGGRRIGLSTGLRAGLLIGSLIGLSRRWCIRLADRIC